MNNLVARAEPRFDLDLDYGKQAEARLLEFFDWFVEGKGKVEAKRKRIIDLSLYVEEFCDKGRTGRYRPSGMSVSTAHVWAFAIAGTGIMVIIPASLLRESLSHPSVKDKAETDGDCPTRGKLVHLQAIFDTYSRSLKAAINAHSVPAIALDNTPINITADDIRWGYDGGTR